MTQTNTGRPRRLTHASATLDVRSSVPYQVSQLLQQNRHVDAYELIEAARAAEAFS